MATQSKTYMSEHLGRSTVILISALIVSAGCRNRTPRATDTTATAPTVSAGTVGVAPLRSPMGRTAASGATTPGTAGAGSTSGAPAAGSGARRDTVAADTTKRTHANVPSTTVAPPPTVAAAAPAPTPPAPPAPSKLAVALARLPFGNRERLEYQVKYGFLGVGSAALEVLGLDTVRGTPAVHATFTVKGGVRVYRVNDAYESWFDPISFATVRAVQNIDEGSYDRQRNFDFFPDRKTFTENDKPEAPTVADPLDEASFLFFLRTIPLEVGQTYEFTRYFRPDRNPVRVVVVRKEHVKVPAGQFDAIVVRPVIKTSGIFGEGGHAEVWFTDDSTRTLVQLKSQLKFGSLNLYLKNRRAGTPWEGAMTVASPTP
jgi:hypothetical protein